jgi:hypothetical protein
MSHKNRAEERCMRIVQIDPAEGRCGRTVRKDGAAGRCGRTVQQDGAEGRCRRTVQQKYVDQSQREVFLILRYTITKIAPGKWSCTSSWAFVVAATKINMPLLNVSIRGAYFVSITNDNACIMVMNNLFLSSICIARTILPRM